MRGPRPPPRGPPISGRQPLPSIALMTGPSAGATPATPARPRRHRRSLRSVPVVLLLVVGSACGTDFLPGETVNPPPTTPTSTATTTTTPPKPKPPTTHPPAPGRAT